MIAPKPIGRAHYLLALLALHLLERILAALARITTRGHETGRPDLNWDREP